MKPSRPVKPLDLPDDLWAAAHAVETAWSHDGTAISTRTTLVDGIARALLAERLKERELCAVTGGDAIIQKHPILAQMVRNAIRSRP